MSAFSTMILARDRISLPNEKERGLKVGHKRLGESLSTPFYPYLQFLYLYSRLEHCVRIPQRQEKEQEE